MRVIWISVFIFLVVFGISVVLHEPAHKSPGAHSGPQATNSVDPFVADTVHDKEVELAALPAEQVKEPVTSPTISESLDESAVPPQTQDQHSTVAKEADIQVAASTTVKVTENSTSTLEVSETGDVSESESLPQSKPMGLLARSVEQKKNENKIAVIVHEENDQALTINEIRAIYLDRITQWEDGSRIMLYNLPLGDRHREKFSKNILNMTALEADEAESQRREHNLAINSVRVKNKNIVVSYVERHPNAIAYVPLSLVRERSNVKVVATLP